MRTPVVNDDSVALSERLLTLLDTPIFRFPSPDMSCGNGEQQMRLSLDFKVART